MDIERPGGTAMSAGALRGRQGTLPRSRQLERPPRFTGDCDRSMILVSVLGLCPELVQGAVEGHRLIPNDEHCAVVKLEDVEFDPATGVPRVYAAKMRRVQVELDSILSDALTTTRQGG